MPALCGAYRADAADMMQETMHVCNMNRADNLNNLMATMKMMRHDDENNDGDEHAWA